MKFLSRYLFLLCLISSSTVGYSQCNWTQVYHESYEYTTPITALLPGVTYQNTPQTYAGCVRTGTYGMYMNIVDGYIGLLYSQPFTDICVGQQYRFSFSTRDAFVSNNDLTIRVKDNGGNILATQNVINGSTWNDITMTSFTATTNSIVFEISTNLAGTGGNDVGFDDLKMFQCAPTPHNYSVTQCLSTPSVNLFNTIASPILSSSGVWTGPSALTNNHLGTFTSGTNTNGLYTYTVDGAPGCADSVANLSVAFIQTPTLNPITNVVTCSSYTLPAISGTLMSGNQKYSTGPGGTGTILNPGAIISNSQTIYVYDGAVGCDDQESFTITFNAPPVISVSANDTVCNGQAAQFTASSVAQGMNYVWTPGNLTGTSISVTPASSTVYSVVGTDVNGCVSNIVSTVAIVRPKPTVTLQISTDSICIGDQVQLMASSSVNGTTYQWNDGSTQAVRLVSPTLTSNYSVVGTSPNGCTDAKSGSVLVVPALAVSISGIPTFCSGSSTTLSVSGNTPGMTTVWTPTGSTNSTFTVTNSTVGWIYVEGSFFGCPTAKDSILTSFSPNPVITVPADFEVCPGTPVTATVSSDLQNSTFIWMPGGLTGPTNTLNPDNSMMYYVYAQNGNCISEIDSFYVDMSLVCNMDVPNIFSPNNDQTNDYFSLVSYSGITSLNVTISNRWGNVMAEFDKPDFKWDGKDQGGNDATEGVYFYNITAKMGSGKDFNQQGFVHLIR
ncbi:gliding motility-associated C-terminal domain-containing protein [Fluviicola taffensis]|uniref:Ig-like domain-containing protein n=1 Tax=Fluviicola taffensis (strain DSM 16823 / NCIMB 13979 / RW262) TaxID=755732 RepID=F2I997_FLUTR|nr:gliding motility-associated C-terminal domain-containing protein [Fluviicola taffensis]AEA44054.1 hypothetical protein Fluta_2068 [Fluviicola taffensis DSM 16823]